MTRPVQIDNDIFKILQDTKLQTGVPYSKQISEAIIYRENYKAINDTLIELRETVNNIDKILKEALK